MLNLCGGGAIRRSRSTLADVARLAEVSSITVSRALRKPDMVSDALRSRIEAAVRELAYIPNTAASRLASGRTYLIGVVVSSLTNGVFAEYLRALHDHFLPAGYQVVVLSSRYSAEGEEKAIETLIGQHPEALILVGVHQTLYARRLLKQCGIPIVQTFELTDDPIDINVGLSQHQAGYEATRLLLKQGAHRIGMIAARLDPRTMSRSDGYYRAVREANRSTDGIVATSHDPTTVELGGQLLAQIVDKGERLDAVFCCDDLLALGALFECQRRGIRVPDQLSIIGFNDLEFARSTHPSLSSVATPRYEMGKLSAEIVIDIIESGERPARCQIDLGFQIKERDSTRRIRKSARMLKTAGA